MQTIDIHSHVIPSEIIDRIERDPARYETRIEGSGEARKVINADHTFLLRPEFYDTAVKLAAMDASGLDVAVLSAAPAVFFYWLDPAVAVDAARVVNDGVARMVASHPDRLLGMGTLPMQDPDAALRELERIVEEHGFRGVELGTSVEAEQLSEPRFRPVLRRAEELGVFVFAHPYFVGEKGGMAPYYLTNLIGNPLHTVIMVANLMFSGTLDELPALRFVLAHGGGYLPYQIGRLTRGWEVRAETRAHCRRSPMAQLSQLYFDTLTHSPASTRFLLDLAGADHVMLGTDAPFPMSDATPVAHLDAVPGLTSDERQAVCCGTARTLLGRTS